MTVASGFLGISVWCVFTLGDKMCDVLSRVDVRHGMEKRQYKFMGKSGSFWYHGDTDCFAEIVIWPAWSQNRQLIEEMVLQDASHPIASARWQEAFVPV